RARSNVYRRCSVYAGRNSVADEANRTGPYRTDSQPTATSTTVRLRTNERTETATNRLKVRFNSGRGRRKVIVEFSGKRKTEPQQETEHGPTLPAPVLRQGRDRRDLQQHRRRADQGEDAEVAVAVEPERKGRSPHPVSKPCPCHFRVTLRSSSVTISPERTY